MTTKHIINCPCCFKIFKKKGCYEKHILSCERIERSTNAPSISQLYEMIQSLTEKYNTVQSELESVKRQINIKNKKLDIIAWLNTHSISNKNSDMLQLSKSIRIDQPELDIIFDKGFVDGIFEVIKNYFIVQQEAGVDFIKCFQQKKNIIYIFSDDKWKILSIEEFTKIIHAMNVKTFSAFNLYRESNIDKLDQDDFQVTFTNNFNKLLSTNMTFEQKCIRIKNKLFSEFNECFKSIVEYQID